MKRSGQLHITNTLSGGLVPFSPIEVGHVRMYTCGLTVYSRGHIGNFRTFVSQDVLRRYLKYKGFTVTQVMNFTDVDDKTIIGARKAGIALREFTQIYIDYFFEDCDTLNIEKAEHYPRATDNEYIDAMVELVQKLDNAGCTYRSDGSIYFKVDSFSEYGKLSRLDVLGMKSGARVDADEYSKENARDFVLWKAPKEGEDFWDTAIGKGRPGWHLECSAMGMKILGETFDIHAGGVDLVFPHHENEIAQSESASGKPFAKYWMHTEFLLVEGEKMSKSKGNQFTVKDLVDERFSPMAIRYLLLSVNYRQQLNFTRDGLEQATTAIRRVDDFLDRLNEVEHTGGVSREVNESAGTSLSQFEAAMDDNLNTSAALAEVFDLVKIGNKQLSSTSMTKEDSRVFRSALEQMNSVLGVFGRGDKLQLDTEVEKFIMERREARAVGDFARADSIRDELLEERGVVLEDTPTGTRWRRK